MAAINTKVINDDLSEDGGLQRYLFHVFTLLALIFLGSYAVMQARAGYTELAFLYAAAAVIVAINRWAIQYHNKLALAANVFASLGPIVLLPWQVTGGIAGTGLLWFPVFVVFVMFFVPGRGGSFWALFTYAASFFLLLLQMQGVVPFPFQSDIMFHFYFVGGITYALTFLFLQAQRIIFDTQKMQVISLKKSQQGNSAGDWEWDIASDTVQWSDHFYALFDMDPDKKVSYASYMNGVYPEDRPIIQDTIQEAMRDHQPFSVIHRYIKQDGSVIWIHSLGEVELNAKGKPVHMHGTAQDITWRMRSEAVAARSSLKPATSGLVPVYQNQKARKNSNGA